MDFSSKLKLNFIEGLKNKSAAQNLNNQDTTLKKINAMDYEISIEEI